MEGEDDRVGKYTTCSLVIMATIYFHVMNN